MIAPIACEVVRVHDGDTFTCANRVTIRVAGVDANELDGGCHNRCATMTGRLARAYVSRLVLQRTLACQPVGQSYRRVVARCALPDGRSLSCTSIAAGAAVRWDRYWREYGIGGCR